MQGFPEQLKAMGSQSHKWLMVTAGTMLVCYNYKNERTQAHVMWFVLWCCGIWGNLILYSQLEFGQSYSRTAMLTQAQICLIAWWTLSYIWSFQNQFDYSYIQNTWFGTIFMLVSVVFTQSMPITIAQ